MRIPYSYLKSNPYSSKGQVITRAKNPFRLLFILALSLSITFNNFAQEEDSDFLDKVLDEKPKKAEPKKLVTQPQPQTPGLKDKDKKKKLGKNAKKTSKLIAKPLDPNKKNKPFNPNPETTNTGNPNSPQIVNNKLNLEYWVHEELAMNPGNIPGFEEPKAANGTNPPVLNPTEKPAEKKSPEKTTETSKPNPFFAFLNEYKKTIFIFAAIIIFAIYHLRYKGARNYNNSGRIFSKFRNK